MDSFLQRLQQGENKLLLSLYEDLLPKVRQWVIANNGTSEEADDIFQDALEALINKSYSDSKITQENLHGYTMQIAKNKWIDKLRRQNSFDKVRSAFLNRLEDEYSIEEEYISIQEEQLKQHNLQAAYEKLSEVCRRLLKMLLDEKSSSEITKELNMSSANTMYRRKHACMKSWKNYYQQIEE